MLHQPHSTYYRDRRSEEELCQDFPADKIFIDGLHAMQAHFDHNGVYIDIPVVRVMNTAHYIAAYMFATTCSGDQLEYDVLAYDSFGRDKKLVPLTMIVLAAMLKRTEGFRARNCRNLILDNRDPDFEEGVTLYDRFLRSAEERFAEEDFLMDTNNQIQKLQAENQQLISENIQLKYTISKMENQQNNQYNNCVIYNAPVFNTNTTNNYYPQAAPAEDVQPVQEEKPATKTSLPFFVPAKLAELGTYTEEEFDGLYHDAVKGGAPKLAKFIKHYKELEVFDTKDLNKKETFEELKAFFGDELNFGYPNFAAYY